MIAKKAKIPYTQLYDLLSGRPLQVYTQSGVEVSPPLGMPATVRVLGQTYSIRYHTRIFNERKANQRLNGLIMYSWRLIFIDADLSIHSMRETLYHEVAHAYLKSVQQRSLPLSNLSATQIEEVCDLFGESFYDLISNNACQ